jgi:undecaprenyl diphosphate synthase
MTSTLQSRGLHVAIIMDGNGRWAVRQGLSRSAGHRAGLHALGAIVETAPELAISTLTLFAFSSDNWKRPRSEVAALITLMRGYLKREAKHFIESQARLVVIGRLDRLPAGLPAEIRRFERATRNGNRLKVRIALDYSSRDSMVRAISLVARKHPLELDYFARLVTASATGEDAGSPKDAEVDLLIRTGGEKRLSDFMLWESAYAELIFSDIMWPDFRPEHLRLAIEEFHRRTRRFGGIGEPAIQHHAHGGANEEIRDAN